MTQPNAVDLIRKIRAGRSFAAETMFRPPGACILCGTPTAQPYPDTAPGDCVAVCAEHRPLLARAYYAAADSTADAAADTYPALLPPLGDNPDHPWGLPEPKDPPTAIRAHRTQDAPPADIYYIQAYEDYEASYPLASFLTEGEAANRFNLMVDAKHHLDWAHSKHGTIADLHNAVKELSEYLPAAEVKWLVRNQQPSFNDVGILHYHRDGDTGLITVAEVPTMRTWPRTEQPDWRAKHKYPTTLERVHGVDE